MRILLGASIAHGGGMGRELTTVHAEEFGSFIGGFFLDEVGDEQAHELQLSDEVWLLHGWDLLQTMGAVPGFRFEAPARRSLLFLSKFFLPHLAGTEFLNRCTAASGSSKARGVSYIIRRSPLCCLVDRYICH